MGTEAKTQESSDKKVFLSYSHFDKKIADAMMPIYSSPSLL